VALTVSGAHLHGRCACQARHGPAWSRARSVSRGTAVGAIFKSMRNLNCA
jgi:hypothetical protein